MKRTLMLLLFAALCATNAQTPHLYSLNPPLGLAPDYGQVLNSEAYSVWSASTQSPVYLTTNAGKLWINIPLPSVSREAYIKNYKLYYRTGPVPNIVACATDSSIYHSADLGIHWTRVKKAAGWIESLNLYDDYNFYAVVGQQSGGTTYYSLMKSLDGISWTAFGNAFNNSGGIEYVHFFASQGVFYIWYKHLGVYRTSVSADGGYVWQTKNWFSSTVGRGFANAFAVGGRVYVQMYKSASENGYFLMSPDSAENYYPVTEGVFSDTTFALYSDFYGYYGQGVFYKNNKHLVTLDYYAGVFYENEYPSIEFRQVLPFRNGSTVLGIYEPANDLNVTIYNLQTGLVNVENYKTFSGDINAILPVSASAAVAPASEGRIAITNNAGKSWGYSQFYSSDNWIDAASPDGQYIFFLSENGALTRGDYSPLYLDFSSGVKRIASSDKFTSLHFFDEFNGIVAAENGTLYRTSNAGDTWLKKPGVASNIRRLTFFPGSDTGFASGSSGILRTTNRGLSWQSVLSSASIYSVAFSPEGTYGVAPGAADVYTSTDRGATWSAVTGPYYSTATDADAIVFAFGDFAITASYPGGVGYSPYSYHYSSDDNGITWAYRKLAGKKIGAIGGWNKHNYFVGGQEGVLYRSEARANTVTINGKHGFKGDTVRVPVSVNFIRGKRYSAFDLKIQTDVSKVQFVEIDTTDLYCVAGGWNIQVNPGTNGLLRVGGYTSQYDSVRSGVLLYLKYKLTGTAGGFSPADFVSAQFNTGSEPVYLNSARIYIDSMYYGDADVNNSVQVYDGAMVLRAVARQLFLSDRGYRQADVTRDGSLSALDASYIVKYVVGLIPSLPVGGPMQPAQGAPVLAARRTAEGKIVVPFSITNGSGILSMQGTFAYDNAKLRFTGIIWSPAAGQFIKEIKAEDGRISFAAASAQETALDGAEICYLTFERRQQWSEEPAEIRLENFRLNENKIAATAFVLSVDAPTGVENSDGLPKEFALEQNFPNPFNPSTVIRYTVPEESSVRIMIYNSLGENVRELVNGIQTAGYYQQDFSAANLPGGVYFCTISATGSQSGKNFVSTKKMLLLK